jgi:hypothetical protein
MTDLDVMAGCILKWLRHTGHAFSIPPASNETWDDGLDPGVNDRDTTLAAVAVLRDLDLVTITEEDVADDDPGVWILVELVRS